MALWLFRKSRRKKSKPSALTNSPGTGIDYSASRRHTTPAMATYGGSLSRPSRHRSIQKKQRGEHNKLQRRARYSFESGRADDIDVAGASRRADLHSASSPFVLTARINTDPLGYMYFSRDDNDSDSSNNNNNYNHDNHLDGNNMHGQPVEILTCHPTLRQPPSKRNGKRLQRSKSSKRRKNAADQEREAELKAMSREDVLHTKNFAPLRPSAEPWTAGRSFRRETIKGHSSFRRRHGREGEQDPSDVSLPTADTIDSAMSSDSEQVAFSVSPLAALAPKPTLRYSSQHRAAQQLGGGGSLPQRLPSQRHRMTQPISEAVLKAHKRVDDLADGLSPSDLRELMERDQRRRDRKRIHEQERALRRLRQAEQQYEGDAAETGGPSSSSYPPNMARGMIGRESAGLGIDHSTSAIVTSATRRQSPSPHPLSPPASPHLGHFSTDSNRSASVIEEAGDVHMSGTDESVRRARRRSPIEDFYRPESSPAPIPTPDSRRPLPTKLIEKRGTSPLPERTNSKIRKLVKGKKRQSAGSSMDVHEKSGKGLFSSSSRKTSSISSSFRASLSWASIGMLFRWGHKKKHGAAHTGPSFSNLSRDNMAGYSVSVPRLHTHSQGHSHWHLPIQSNHSVAPSAPPTATAPASAHGRPAKQPHPFKVQSNVPKRTLSRFREDLPDFLMSPPASRETSAVPMSAPPVQEPLPTVGNETSYYLEQDDEEEEHGVSRASLAVQASSEQMEQIDQIEGRLSEEDVGREVMRDTPTSWLRTNHTNNSSPEPQQAMSLASVDSEGSWLSGRIAKRRLSGQDSIAGAGLGSLDNVARSFQKPPQAQERYLHQKSWTSNETSQTSPTGGAAANVAPSEEEGAANDTASGTADVGVDGDVADYQNRISPASSSTFLRGGSLSGELQPVDSDVENEKIMEEEEEEEQQQEEEEEDENPRWGAVKHHKAVTLVTQPTMATAMKSHEGLLKSFYEGEDDKDYKDDADHYGVRADSVLAESPTSLVSPVSQISQASQVSSDEFKEEEAGVQRATSINLGRGHVRHISAGSAKLFEISPRSSVDAKGRVDSLIGR